MLVAMLLGLILIAIAIAAASWGTTGATMTLLSREAAASPLLVGWSRLAIAAPVLVLAAAGAARFGAHPPARRPWPSLADLPLCAALGLTMAAYQVCYFRAVTLVGVAPAALLAICSAPILIAVLAALFLGERLTPLVRLSLGMAVAGTALLVVGPRGFSEIAGHFGLGALLALGAGVSYAVYAVAAKGLLARVTPLAVSAITFALAALFLAPALLGEAAPGRAVARSRPAGRCCSIWDSDPPQWRTRCPPRDWAACPRPRPASCRCSSLSPPPRSACSSSASAWAPSASPAPSSSSPPSPSSPPRAARLGSGLTFRHFRGAQHPAPG